MDRGRGSKAKKAARAREVYQLKVTLRGTRPPIWRRVQVYSDATLERLHRILQVVMGWTDSHLHQFCARGIYYGMVGPELDFDFEVVDERKVRLHDVLRRPKDRMQYEYDFGDSWDHDVVLERITGPAPQVRYPLVLAGRRACPPEDAGGVWGYAGFLRAIKDPKHPEHDDFIEWIGGTYDPEGFDVQEANRAFHGGWGPARSDR